MRLSICIIARNEERLLPKLLKDIASQQYPHDQAEVVLVDSMSSDSTRHIMEAFAQESDYRDVQVLDNPGITQACGWNVAIRHARGDVISRIDAHASVRPDFFSLVMQDIDSGEDIVGGRRPCILAEDTPWQRALLAVENSLFGSSISKSRRGEKASYVASMFHASYRREVFDRVGLFNEALLRTEDNELHWRMREAGYRLYFDPQIVSYQVARNCVPAMVRQKFGNGYWIGITAKHCPQCLSPYHFVPAAFVGAIVAAAVTAHKTTLPAALLASTYGAFCMVATAASARQAKAGPLTLVMPMLFPIMHVSYGIGTFAGLLVGKPLDVRS